MIRAALPRKPRIIAGELAYAPHAAHDLLLGDLKITSAVLKGKNVAKI